MAFNLTFNPHYNLAGRHAFLTPSSNAWLNYDEDKLNRVYKKHRQDVRGSKIHELANQHIALGILAGESATTFNMYVNDAIRFRMRSEQTLYYSDNCFGSADTICFRDNVLRIHDLKTGATKTTFVQLMVYAALFCLEYLENPLEIEIELRIYQNDAVKVMKPEGIDIVNYMETIKWQDRVINARRAEEF